MKSRLVLFVICSVLIIGMSSISADGDRPNPILADADETGRFASPRSEAQYIPDSVIEEMIEQASFICEIACNTAAAAGAAACASLSGPAYWACLAAVEALREECLKEC